nr:TetR/AcrR family transcriptional regulator [Pseudopedobacter sp.]
MSRQKQYNEQEVVEKAMYLFWQNGYESTSVRMLEKKMGINQFSIYASFGSKQNLFLESLKCYREKMNEIIEVLEKSENGLSAIKSYFFSFLKFSKSDHQFMGCLVTNTFNESILKSDPILFNELTKFTEEIKSLFVNILSRDINKSEVTVERQANYLLASILGLSVSSKILSEQQLNDYINTVFEQL